jgi:hypothetical protein
VPHFRLGNHNYLLIIAILCCLLLAGSLLSILADKHHGVMNVTTPVSNSYNITPYVNPAGYMPGRVGTSQPTAFQQALGRALNMRFNVSTPSTTVPLSMGWNSTSAVASSNGNAYTTNAASSYATSSQYGYGSGYSPLIPASMIRTGNYLGGGGGYYGYYTNPYSTTPSTGYVSPWQGGNTIYNNPYVPTTPVIREPTTTDPTSPTTGIDDDTAEYNYSLEKVGEIARAPMAMFEHNGELVISVISRNDISYTPVYTYSTQDGIRERTPLPVQAESGHYGYSVDGLMHLTPESNGGMIDYTTDNLDGSWTKTDFTHLNPHSYKNLKWGASYICPKTGRQFMGFGNAGHSGVLITYNESVGEWETFCADPDIRFPGSMGVITGGSNDGTVVVGSAAYGNFRIHKVNDDGSATSLMEFGQWGELSVDHSKRVFYAVLTDGTAYSASFDDLNNWNQVKVVDEAGNSLGKMEGLGMSKVHPQTGRMVFSAVDGSGERTDTSFYESRYENGEIVLKRVATLEGVGEWAGKMTVVGDDIYFGAGVDTNQAADRTHGAIYRLNLSQA